MKLKQLSLAVTALCATAGASAAGYSFTMPLAPANPFVQLTQVAGSSFLDTFSFTAPAGAADVSGSVISVDITPFFNVDNILISLFDSDNVLVAGGSAGEGSQLQNIPVTVGSAYYFEVQGAVTGSAGGYYTFTAIAAPIPEPETYALMLGGLGLIGFMAARRRQR